MDNYNQLHQERIHLSPCQQNLLLAALSSTPSQKSKNGLSQANFEQHILPGPASSLDRVYIGLGYNNGRIWWMPFQYYPECYSGREGPTSYGMPFRVPPSRAASLRIRRQFNCKLSTDIARHCNNSFQSRVLQYKSHF
jgi:hypothetical protein